MKGWSSFWVFLVATWPIKCRHATWLTWKVKELVPCRASCFYSEQVTMSVIGYTYIHNSWSPIRLLRRTLHNRKTIKKKKKDIQSNSFHHHRFIPIFWHTLVTTELLVPAAPIPCASLKYLTRINKDIHQRAQKKYSWIFSQHILLCAMFLKWR